MCTHPAHLFSSITSYSWLPQCLPVSLAQTKIQAVPCYYLFNVIIFYWAKLHRGKGHLCHDTWNPRHGVAPGTQQTVVVE